MLIEDYIYGKVCISMMNTESEVMCFCDKLSRGGGGSVVSQGGFTDREKFSWSSTVDLHFANFQNNILRFSVARKRRFTVRAAETRS